MLELSLLCCYKNVDDLCVPKRKCVCKRSLTSLLDKERESVCTSSYDSTISKNISFAPDLLHGDRHHRSTAAGS